MSTLLHHVRHPSGPGSVLITGGRIGWMGRSDQLPELPPGTTVRELRDRLVLPAFVDAHVHTTETGLSLAGVNLSGVRSAAGMLELVAAAAAARPGQPVVGHGWDELRITGGLPTAGELDRAAHGADVYLTRVDVHSALVSAGMADRLRLGHLDGWASTGRVERDAHHAARKATRFGIGRQQREQLQRSALDAAAAAGIAEVHECAARHITPEQDLRDLLELAAAQPVPRVVPYWGELAGSAEDALAIRDRVLGTAGPGSLAGLAGDLIVDGSFGSHTAALYAAYADYPGDTGGPGHRGHLYLDAEAIGRHIRACTLAGLQAGFHAIGDRGVGAVIEGLERAARALGPQGGQLLRRAQHRIEHVEGIGPAALGVLREFGVTASVQPMFDHEWGGPGGMYEHRLGSERMKGLNPLAGLQAAGVRLAFGSDSPVTPFGPWQAIRAAVRHHTPQHRMAPAQALSAHLGRSPRLRIGDIADLAIWDSPSLDDALAMLIADGIVPSCLLTLRGGAVIAEEQVTTP